MQLGVWKALKVPHRSTQRSASARLPPLFLWKRERRRKEGPFHYHPTCRLMPNSSSQPTVVMAATCHVICVSPCINVDVWDRRPPAGTMHKSHGKCVSPAGSRGPHPRQPALLFIAPGMVEQKKNNNNKTTTKNKTITKKQNPVISGTTTSAAGAARWAARLLQLPSRQPFCVWVNINLQLNSLSVLCAR